MIVFKEDYFLDAAFKDKNPRKVENHIVHNLINKTKEEAKDKSTL